MKTFLSIAAIVLLGACGKKEAPAPAAPTQAAKPEPVKPEPAKPEPVKPEPVKPEPVKPEPEPVKPEPVKPEPVADAVDPQKAIDALFDGDEAVEAPDVAILVPETQTLYYTEGYSVEGTGLGLNLVMQDRAKREEVEVHTAEHDEAGIKAGVAKAKTDLLAKLAGKSIVLLEARPWPVENAETADAKPSARMPITELGAILAYANNKVTATDEQGKTLAELDLSKEATKPHTPVMGQVYFKAGVGIILVEVGFDPGNQYGEFNFFSKSYLVNLRP